MANGIFSKLFNKVKASNNPKSVVNSSLKNGDTVPIESFNSHQDVGSIRLLGNDTNDIIKELHRYDADAANALWAMLRFANTKLNIIYKDEKGNFDSNKTKEFNTTLKAAWLFSTNKLTPEELSDAIRRQLFLYGGVGLELVLDKAKLPIDYILIKATSISWKYNNGRYKPFQKKQNGQINLDIPTFFFQDLDKDPDEATAESPLLTAIQAIAFKQTVVADIQRVMKKAGYPKLKVKVLEDVLVKHAPREIRADEIKLAKWLGKKKTEIATELSKVKPEEALVIFDSISIDYLSNGSGSAIVDFRPIVSILDSQVVSSLKSLPSILGKGSGNQNVASVEAKVYINTPTYLQRKSEKLMSQVLTMSARLMGYKGFIECTHDAIDLRPSLELEPQRLAKQNRILQLQSFGHITDDEAALILGIEHEPVKPLSGTDFLQTRPGMNVENITPNTDPLGRSITGGSGAGSTTGSSNKKIKK